MLTINNLLTDLLIRQMLEQSHAIRQTFPLYTVAILNVNRLKLSWLSYYKFICTENKVANTGRLNSSSTLSHYRDLLRRLGQLKQGVTIFIIVSSPIQIFSFLFEAAGRYIASYITQIMEIRYRQAFPHPSYIKLYSFCRVYS